MKYIIILLSAISLCCILSGVHNAGKEMSFVNPVSLKWTNQPIDTASRPRSVAISDTVPLLSKKDIQDLHNEVLGQVPAMYTEPIIDWLVERIKLRAGQYAQHRH